MQAPADDSTDAARIMQGERNHTHTHTGLGYTGASFSTRAEPSAAIRPPCSCEGDQQRTPSSSNSPELLTNLQSRCGGSSTTTERARASKTLQQEQSAAFKRSQREPSTVSSYSLCHGGCGFISYSRLQNKSEPSEVTGTVTSPNSLQRRPGNLCASLNHSNETVGGITPSPVHTRTLFKGSC